jgi:geranylgeranyl diphosphate synthase type II
VTDIREVEDYISRWAARIEARLEGLLPPGAPAEIVGPMKYSLLGGGKRLRPVMTVAAFETVGGPEEWRETVLDAACAVEMIHTYSLIHDDLPCMDDDDWRRGRPTSHRVFGEGLAVLAGDGLLTLAFEVLAGARRPSGGPGAERLLRSAFELASAAGPSGMVGGQAVDIGLAGGRAERDTVEFVHRLKTARLFSGAVAAGAIIGGGGAGDVEAMKRFALEFGVGFQIADDLEDWLREEGETGASYVAAVGAEEARTAALERLHRARGELEGFGRSAWVLNGIARLIESRVLEGTRDR